MHPRHTLLAIAAIASITSAQAVIITTAGALTTSDPTFNRPLENLSGLSTFGTAVPYDVLQFVVSTSGAYTFLTTALFDSFVILYSPAFSASSQLTNALIADDDLLGLTTSGFSFNLTAGTNYFYINTAFANGALGGYSNTIGGPGVITVVPEIGTYAMMALGLGVLGIARRRATSRAT